MATGIRCPSCGDVHHLAPPILLTICSCGEKLRHLGHGGSASHSQQGADLYEVLGVDRSASADDLRAAYRQRARETHPDAGGAPGEFQAVQAAWEVLSDEERRRRYDRSGTTHRAGAQSRDVPDILDVSVIVAVRRLVSAGFAPRLMLVPPPHDQLAGIVVGQSPAPGGQHVAGAMVDVVIAGSDAGVILTGVKRDAQRVGEDLKDSAVASAASAVRGVQTFTKWLLRLVAIVIAMAVVIATSIIVGVYRPLVGLTILLLGSAIVVLWVQRSSKRRRTQQPDAGTSLRVR